MYHVTYFNVKDCSANNEYLLLRGGRAPLILKLQQFHVQVTSSKKDGIPVRWMGSSAGSEEFAREGTSAPAENRVAILRDSRL